MTEFKVDDWVYAGEWCYGQIVGLTDPNLAYVEFDTGTGGGCLTFDIDELYPAEPPKAYSIRDNLLITAGARAAYMDARGDIDIPGGLEGEDRLAEFIVNAVQTYGKITDDIPFDEFIETELYNEFGKGE